MSTTEMGPTASAEVRVHSPYRRGLPKLGVYLRDLWGRRQFIVEMARTEVRSQHLNTALGQMWVILNPLLLAAVYFLLVSLIRKGTGGADAPGNILLNIVGGIFLYYFFNACVMGGAGSIVGGGRLILNTAFPKAALPLSAVLVAVFRFLPTIPIFVVFRLALGEGLTVSMLWAIPVFAITAVIGLGAAMLFATLNLYFRDVRNFLPYLLRMGLYLSPILWFAEKVTGTWAEPVVLAGQPLFAPMATWSQTMVLGEGPQLSYLLVSIAWALGLLVVGSWIFLSREREFAVRL